MRIEFTQVWDQDFFKKFVTFKNELYQGEKLYLEESLEYFQRVLSADSAFSQYNKWIAWLIFERDRIVGRVLASRRQDENFNSEFIPFGHFEASTPEAAKNLLQLVQNWTKGEGGHLKMRGPIQGNVFNSSRFTLWTKKHFYSEPYHKESYQIYFKNFGMAPSQHWVSIRYSRFKMLKANILFYKRLISGGLHRNPYQTRQIDLNHWDRDFKLMYELLIDSFSSMPDVEKLTFEEFKLFNYDLRKIIRPKDGIFLEDNGKAIGFFVLLNDQHKWIVRAQNWRLRNKKLGIFAMIILGLRIKLGIGRTLLLYLGKTHSDSKYQKLAPILYQEMFQRRLFSVILRPPIFGFLADNSPSFKMITAGFQVVGEYVMYEKAVEVKK